MTGISRSVTTTAGRSRSASTAPSAPSRAVMTSKPARSQGADEQRAGEVAVVDHQDAGRAHGADSLPAAAQDRVAELARRQGDRRRRRISRATLGMPKTTEVASSWTIGQAAGPAQRHEPLGAVAPHAGQQHAGDLRAGSAWRRTGTARPPTAGGRRAAG